MKRFGLEIEKEYTVWASGFYKCCIFFLQAMWRYCTTPACVREITFKKGLCKCVNHTVALVYNPSELRLQSTTSLFVSAEESQLSKMMWSH